ncbi:hypothetical protein WYH_02251 [Croceibacterium atlanticum]|uniref:Lipoprotein n=2 Tax=Croceibacterium atlanticum TaxID=1267766 RepID=A0A0F7KS48_9SPHN|nr:hypothetical protein [Croceibacterium atlanticum]AKH43283.1 hypothetical protein WYH_02251 [Croceibacterium atlanticum]
MRPIATLLLLPLLAGCAAVPSPNAPEVPRRGEPAVSLPIPPTRPAPRPQPGFRAPKIMDSAGLDGVIRQDRAGLVQQFGQPRLDVAEGDMRKLQFAGQACVLDIFLYPLRPAGEPVATHVEARRASDGRDVDRAACARALQRERR